MSLQRYFLIDGEMIPNDNGDLCHADDVTEIEKRHSAVIDNHIHFSSEEFYEFATFAMENDSLDQSAHVEVIHSMLDQIAIKCLGFNDWIQAYHEVNNN